MADASKMDQGLLEACAARVRLTLGGGRSDRLRQLFDYLLLRTLSGGSPTEQEIVAEAFSDAVHSESGPDSSVRVCIHRLRKAIDATFAGEDGPKLKLPLGEYRIHLVDDHRTDFNSARSLRSVLKAKSTAARNARRGAAIVFFTLAAGLLYLWLNDDRQPLAETPFWKDFTDSTRPVIVVPGDYYLFAEIDEQATRVGSPPTLVHDRSVPTAEDLTILHILEPEKENILVDYAQQYVSGGTIEAMSIVRRGFATLPKLVGKPVKLIAASKLTPEDLVSSDIIYIGQLSGMPGLLRDPISLASGFQFDPGFEGLSDEKSGTQFQSDRMTLTDERIARRDFAYLSRVPGPAGNRILVIAGVSDAGVKEAAQIARDIDKLHDLGRDPKSVSDGFEALFRVRTIQSINVGSSLVVDRKLQSHRMWDDSGNVPVYRPIPIGNGNDR